MKSKIVLSILCCALVFFICLENVFNVSVFCFGSNITTTYAINEINEKENIFTIYTENGDFLFERQNVEVGDEYVDKKMRMFKVVEVNEETKTGKAKFVEQYSVPKVKKKEDATTQVASVSNSVGLIGLYMTHNDESYVSGDGYDSIYGKGGVHDIAEALSLNLNSKRISTIVSQNLHIPHDSKAYSRSYATANSLLNNYHADAIFDIHRDGTSRGFYVTKVNGEERCMVRMVVGKSNPNYTKNKAFALFLMSVAETYAPWLFVDIYMGTGHYNQALSEYAMLFEMGSHLVEKDMVLETVPVLAEVISVALYGELEIVEDEKNNNNSSSDTSENENQIENSQNSNQNNSSNQIQQNGSQTGNNNTNQDSGANQEIINPNLPNSDITNEFNSNFSSNSTNNVNQSDKTNQNHLEKTSNSANDIISVFVLLILVSFIVYFAFIRRK